MNTRIHESLARRNGNYILPFFWQHGEEGETLRRYMGVIQDMGIQAVCLESRPHPDYAGPKWWEDMDIILDEAERRHMKVWILDDCHFPTGYANGKVKQADSSLQKWTVFHLTVDLVGPSDIRVDVGGLLSDMGIGFPLTPENPLARKKELLHAILCKRRDEYSEDLLPEFLEITGDIKDGLLPVSVPEGYYRLFLIYKSANAGLANNDYVNLLQKESVKILLDAVYEPHYQRYGKHFGNTIAGFFSDEPGFYNCIDTLFNFDAVIGRLAMPLPWSAQLEERLASEQFAASDFVRLWYDVSPEEDAAVRYTYMDHVTKLYEENFSLQLGDWCRSHHVEYIGHILEDNNSSSRLGPSAGHYFRAMSGQDMSGIDVVTSQILPGRKNLHTTNAAYNTKSDGEFYHYALAKLGASDVHICPEKKGRAMCEIYGNYGWAEGAQTMKWLTDFMLVRGINVFVPHAFSPAPFPDPDCPPHFYAHGNNLQAPYLKYLFRYVNRASHILCHGRSASSIGILYHAEAEWSGSAMLYQKPGRVCLEHQADYDVIPADKLADAGLDGGAQPVLTIGNLDLRLLIVPACDRLPLRTLEALARLSREGFPVIFVDSLPFASSEGIPCADRLHALESSAKVVELRALGDYIAAQRLPVILIPSGNKYEDLRAYQYRGDGYECVLFMNESIHRAVHEEVMFPSFVPYLEYDAYENALRHLDGDSHGITLHLEPGESRMFISEIATGNLPIKPCRKQPVSRTELSAPITLSVSRAPESNAFETIAGLERLEDLSTWKEFSDFHGILRYELDIDLDLAAGKDKFGALYLDGANEVVSVSVNHHPLSVRIGAPYRFEIGDSLRQGKNHLTIENVTTVYPFKKDSVSVNTGIHPLGICGKIWLESC